MTKEIDDEGSQPFTRSISFWLLVVMACLVTALYFSPIYALVLLVVAYGCVAGWALRERVMEKGEMPVTPPIEPLPNMHPAEYQLLPDLVPSPWRSKRVVAESPPTYAAKSDTLDSIRQIYQSIYELVVVNRGASVVQVIGDDILREAGDLVNGAEQVSMVNQRLISNILPSRVTKEEIERLEARVSAEADDRLRRTLDESLHAKQTEFQTVQDMERDRVFHEALLSQAEASLSELRSRLALTISASHDYETSDEGRRLTEANNEVRSISETMQRTLRDLE